MSDKQRVAFFAGLWRRVCEIKGWDPQDRAIRIEFLSGAVGRGLKSSKELNQTGDYDSVLKECEAIINPDNLAPQMRLLRQPRARMMHVLCNELSLALAVVLDDSVSLGEGWRLEMEWVGRAERYILAIARDKYHAEGLEELTDGQLHMLLVDVTRAINNRRKPRGLSMPQVEGLAKRLGREAVEEPF